MSHQGRICSRKRARRRSDIARQISCVCGAQAVVLKRLRGLGEQALDLLGLRLQAGVQVTRELERIEFGGKNLEGLANFLAVGRPRKPEHGEVVRLRQVQVAALGDLLEFAGAHTVRSLADQPARTGVDGAGQVEGVGEEQVAEEDADLVPPPGVHSRNVPPQLGFVENVVVNERRGVDHLHRRGEGVVLRR